MLIGVVPHRDLADFEERARRYDDGWRGGLHHEISRRVCGFALKASPEPRWILDVGCGTGHLLGLLAEACPGAVELVGVDPAPSMVEVARSRARDPRIVFSAGAAEQLPLPDARFDLVVSTTSFDHWADQARGLGECRRVLRPGGCLTLADQFSNWLLPTVLLGRRGKARTVRRASRLVAAAGFTSLEWHDVYASFIRAVTATRWALEIP